MSVQSLLLQQQQLTRRPVVQPQPAPELIRRFTVWMGVTIPTHYHSMSDIAAAVQALRPDGVWDETEVLLKAGEGGSWQAQFDSHPLAIGSAADLAARLADGKALGIRVTPYVVVRAKPQWVMGEQQMIRACVAVTGRCVLNVEPGTNYYNGPADAVNGPPFIRNYLRGIGMPPSTLEVCTIPRATQIAELGGVACLQAWTDPALVGSASWECYGLAAPGTGASSLEVDVAIARLDGWGVPEDLLYRIPVVQRDERETWSHTIWCVQGMQLWWLDGN